jgi:hypothetical protein
MDIDENKKTLDLVWNDVYDLNVYVVNQLNKEILTGPAKPGSGKPSAARHTLPKRPRRTAMRINRKLYVLHRR